MHNVHGFNFCTSAVSLVMGKVKNDIVDIPVRDFLRTLLAEHHFLEGAPFLWVGMLYLYGIKNDLKVRFKRINKKYGDLPISVELDMDILIWADRNNLDLLSDIFMIACLESLIQVANKYKLPKEFLEKEREKYGSIPNTIDECVAYKRP